MRLSHHPDFKMSVLLRFTQTTIDYLHYLTRAPLPVLNSRHKCRPPTTVSRNGSANLPRRQPRKPNDFARNRRPRALKSPPLKMLRALRTFPRLRTRPQLQKPVRHSKLDQGIAVAKSPNLSSSPATSSPPAVF